MNESIRLTFTRPKTPDADLQRNRKARELRTQGWTVKCGHTDFSDLARGDLFWLEANRDVKGGD